ncbi:hypothetical protein [Staphylococcus gallinarum]|uniref:hypothetical protein n=1 Tax=Staphylococcus gallinarum TaxID=1293 RepID=UPI000E69AD48|nr:hypothetical protein [Staphylococcus gallinarum]RIL22700.1 hypothetical protein BUY99_06460 [Staphylococcus gallinarum]RIO85708.1 hypothetical protein BUZ10_04935 [Staphylococcus gallinarum]
MIIYLPHYDNGEAYSDYWHHISNNAYYKYEDAVKEINSKGYIIKEIHELDEWDIEEGMSPNRFYKETDEHCMLSVTGEKLDNREFAYVHEIKLLDGYEVSK